MANWSDLKAAVASIVKTNGNKEITGQLLQDVLNNIISNVGLNSTFAGIATPETNPGTTDGNIFYIASEEGVYSNFNGIKISKEEVAILEWRGSWQKKDAGIASQQSVSKLSSNITDIAGYDGSKFVGTKLGNVTSGYFLDGNGKLQPNELYYVTDYIPYEDDTTSLLYIKGIELGGGAICMYNSDKTFTFGGAAQDELNSLLLDSETGLYAVSRRGSSYSAYIRISFKLHPTSNINSVEYSFSVDGIGRKLKDGSVKRSTLSREVKRMFDSVYTVINENVGIKYPSEEKTYGYYLSTNGDLVINPSYVITGYIPIETDTTKMYIRGAGLGGGNIVFYNSDKSIVAAYQGNQYATLLNGDTGEYEIPIPSNTSYVRISYTEVLNELEYSFLQPLSKNGLKDNVVAEDALNDALKNKINARILYPVKIDVLNKASYYTELGEKKADSNQYYSSAEYDVSMYDKIEKVAYYFGGGLPSDLCGLILLDAEGNIIEAIKEPCELYDFDLKYASRMVISFRTNIPPIVLVRRPNRERSVLKGEISNNEYTYFGETTYIKKNVLLTANIKILSGYTYLRLGRGRGMYFNKEIYVSKIAVSLGETYKELGFELKEGDIVTISIQSDEFNRYTTTISRGEDKFETNEFDFYADGSPYLRSDGIYCFSAQQSYLDATRSVFFYGDSYSGTSYAVRWPYVAAKFGCKFLVNGLTGGNSYEMFFQVLQDISRYGVPKVILWGLGMNDPVDSTASYEVSNEWKWYLDGLAGYCHTLGIRFVPCTIPSVPGRYHGAKYEYIKQNYPDHVDLASAVDNGIDSNWIEGALHTDGVHPTEFGAYLLAVKALSDCPDLAE